MSQLTPTGRKHKAQFSFLHLFILCRPSVDEVLLTQVGEGRPLYEFTYSNAKLIQNALTGPTPQNSCLTWASVGPVNLTHEVPCHQDLPVCVLSLPQPVLGLVLSALPLLTFPALCVLALCDLCLPQPSLCLHFFGCVCPCLSTGSGTWTGRRTVHLWERKAVSGGLGRLVSAHGCFSLHVLMQAISCKLKSLNWKGKFIIRAQTYRESYDTQPHEGQDSEPVD